MQMRVVAVLFSLSISGAALAQTPAASPEASATPEATPAPAPAAPPVWSAKPYGMLSFVGMRSERPVNNLDLPTFVGSKADAPAWMESARGSRIGLTIYNVSGPGLYGSVKINGTVEADFNGGEPGQGLGEVSPLLRLRLAYARAEWSRFNVEIGQDWSVFAPLNPKSVVWTILPEFQQSGNLYLREPMIAAGASIGPITFRAAAVDPADPAGPAAYAAPNIAGPGELSAAPAGEARLGFSKKFADSRLAVDAGLSGRYGTERIKAGGASIPADGVALDGKIGWGSLAWVQGEAFQGENLDTYVGFEGTQVLVVGTGAAATTALGPKSIKQAGGWIQAGVAWSGVELSAAYAEQTNARDDYGAGNKIAQNQTWTAALTWRPAPTLALAAEYDYLQTTARASGTAPFTASFSRQLALGMTLSF